jgi:hypothetical protein
LETLGSLRATAALQPTRQNNKKSDDQLRALPFSVLPITTLLLHFTPAFKPQNPPFFPPS